MRDLSRNKVRGRYFTLEQAAAAYPAFTPRLFRRLVQERRIAFSKVGRRIVLAEADIEAASRCAPFSQIHGELTPHPFRCSDLLDFGRSQFSGRTDSISAAVLTLASSPSTSAFSLPRSLTANDHLPTATRRRA